MNRILVPTLLLAVCCVVGCADGLKEFSCERASGVVLCEGQPVQEAQVYFSPKMTGKSAVVGKAGFSWTGEDGRFVLSTYGNGDGAVLGPHIVRVTTSNKYACNCVGEETQDLMEVEIKKGEKNEFEISLPKRTAPAEANPFDDDDDDDEQPAV